jgi:ubiquinone/menaquinone biosynthesis C-methylase UbiE
MPRTISSRLSWPPLGPGRSKLQVAGATNASVRHGDATASPYPDSSANLVIIHQVLHFLDDPARALNEAARVLKPGGRLIVVEFAPHTLEHLRAEHAHRHLGVSEADMARWAERAGLTVKAAKTFRAPNGEKGISVMVWSAESQKAAREGTGKRSAA